MYPGLLFPVSHSPELKSEVTSVSLPSSLSLVLLLVSGGNVYSETSDKGTSAHWKKPPNKGHNSWSQCFLYSEVPLYTTVVDIYSPIFVSDIQCDNLTRIEF